jgi:hypothetical protein
LFSRAAKIFGICEQKQLKLIACFVFSRAAKIFGICEQKQLKLTVLCSAAHRNFLEFVNKTTQIDGFWSAAQRKEFVNKTTQIDYFVFSRATKIFGICEQKKQLKLTVLCSARQRKFWNL